MQKKAGHYVEPGNEARLGPANDYKHEWISGCIWVLLGSRVELELQEGKWSNWEKWASSLEQREGMRGGKQ